MRNIFWITQKSFINNLFQIVDSAIKNNDLTITNKMQISIVDFLRSTHIISTHQCAFTVNDLRKLRAILSRNFRKILY